MGSQGFCPQTLLPQALRMRGDCLTAEHVVNDLDDAVGVGLRLHQLQALLVLVGLAKQALARAQQDGEDQQVIAIDQTRVGKRGAEGGRAVDEVGPPSCSLSAATSSRPRRMVASQPGSALINVVLTT